jgi:hypothetical protein
MFLWWWHLKIRTSSDIHMHESPFLVSIFSLFTCQPFRRLSDLSHSFKLNLIHIVSPLFVCMCVYVCLVLSFPCFVLLFFCGFIKLSIFHFAFFHSLALFPSLFQLSYHSQSNVSLECEHKEIEKSGLQQIIFKHAQLMDQHNFWFLDGTVTTAS